MQDITIVEHCFGSDVRINGKSIEIDELNKNNPEEAINLRKELISELLDVVDKINTSDLKYIAEIIVTLSNKFEYSEEESNDGSSCDQCGNWNYINKYIKNN